MKTSFILLAKTDGRPVMNLAEIAELLGLEEATAANRCYARTMPFPVFKVGSKWAAHIDDVAAYLDSQRAAAAEEMRKAA